MLRIMADEARRTSMDRQQIMALFLALLMVSSMAAYAITLL
jgi:hypothetical protein